MPNFRIMITLNLKQTNPSTKNHITVKPGRRGCPEPTCCWWCSAQGASAPSRRRAATRNAASSPCSGWVYWRAQSAINFCRLGVAIGCDLSRIWDGHQLFACRLNRLRRWETRIVLGLWVDFVQLSWKWLRILNNHKNGLWFIVEMSPGLAYCK